MRGWSLAFTPLPSTMGIGFPESFFLSATTARGILLGPPEALWLPQAQRSRNPGDFKAAPERESIQRHVLLLGGDTSVETTILE